MPGELTPVVADDLDRGEGATWQDLLITGDLSGIAIEGLEIIGCRLDTVALTGTDLPGVNLRDVVIEGSELSGALLYDAHLRRVEIRDCRMSGLVLAGAHVSDLAVSKSKLDQANLRMLVGERARFAEVDLRGAELYESAIAEAAFVDCNLSGTDFTKVRLPGARLHGSRLDGIKGAKDLTSVVITPEQQIPLALALLASVGVVVDEGDG